jgi:site-specific DNA-cytosine methylase
MGGCGHAALTPVCRRCPFGVCRKARLQKVGYKVKARVLDSMRHGGIPQVRERTYVVAYKPFNGRKFHFPKSLKQCMPTSKVLDKKSSAAQDGVRVHTRIL